MINRYLVNFNLDNLELKRSDVLIIGAGIAGLNAALNLDSNLEVVLLTKGSNDECNTEYAQGGIAAPIGKNDNPSLHVDDTLKAGGGLCNPKAVEIMAAEAKDCIEDLLDWGVDFTYQGQYPALAQEGGHSRRRILHAKDTTGKEIRKTLFNLADSKANIKLKSANFVVDLVTKDKRCLGALVYDSCKEEMLVYQASQVIIAAGGAGNLYQQTSNPPAATGDGIAAAYRAGAEVIDLEFFQFHPTVLYQETEDRFLISEAVRGEGGILRNQSKNRFMPNYHPDKELAPRDVVARAIYREIKNQELDYVYLDVTDLEAQFIKNRFPAIYKQCQEVGLEITKELIPVTPAAHYLMGGIKTDLQGATNLAGLSACGEAACVGLHGANRLASNSLLDGLVYSRRTAKRINRSAKKWREVNRQLAISYQQQVCGETISTDLKDKLQALMSSKVGIIRREEELAAAERKLINWLDYLQFEFKDPTIWEVQNLLTIAYLVVKSARQRKESRGAHYRSDYPKSDLNWQYHILRQRRQGWRELPVEFN